MTKDQHKTKADKFKIKLKKKNNRKIMKPPLISIFQNKKNDSSYTTKSSSLAIN